MFHICHKVIQLVRIGLPGKNGGTVIIGKGFFDHIRRIRKIQYASIMLLRVTAVQSGKRLHGFDVRQRLVHIHRMQQRFIKTSLKHIRHNQNTVRVLFEFL